MYTDNRERNLRKKLRLLESKEETKERNIKIDKIKEDLIYYDNLRVIKENKKIKITIKEKTSDEFLEEAFQENHKFWQEAKKNQEERKKNCKNKKKEKKYENEKEEYFEEVKSYLYKNENIERICNQIKKDYNVNIPKNIKDFIDSKFNKIEYNKLVKEYHPDKKKYEPHLCELFTQLINEHKF